MNKVETINGICQIYKNYDVFILDQWGVMHDGSRGYFKAIECVNKLHDHNKKLTIISNSSKKTDSTILKLPELGFNPNFFSFKYTASSS